MKLESLKTRRAKQKHTGLVALLAEMPPDLYASLSSVRDFRCDALSEYTTKPLSVMGYASITRIAENMDELDLKFVPKLLGTIGSVSKRDSGTSMWAPRLSALQFIHAQFYGRGDTDGLLHEWAEANPKAALALIIAALVYNNKPLVTYWRRKSSQSGIIRNRSGNIGCRSKAAILNDFLLTFLAHTEFFQNMNTSLRYELLGLIGDVLCVTKEDPQKTLEKRAVELHMAAIQSPEDPQYVAMVMESSLSLANIAHIFRREINTHVGWCTSRMEDLQGATILPDNTGIKFSLSRRDVGSEHYSFTHALVLKSIIIPWVSLWVKAATRARDAGDSFHPLCAQALALASKYETMDPSLTPAAAASTVVEEEAYCPHCCGSKSELNLKPYYFIDQPERSSHSDGMVMAMSRFQSFSSVKRQQDFANHPDLLVGRLDSVNESFHSVGVQRSEPSDHQKRNHQVQDADFLSVCKMYEVI